MFITLARNIYYSSGVSMRLPIRMASCCTCIFPFAGAYYFIVNPQIWPFYVTILIPQLILTLMIYLIMYIMLYPLEAFLSLVFYGPAGLISAWFSVLQQAGIISSFIVTFLLIPEIQRVAFDAVLSKEYSDDIILIAKLRREDKVPFLARFGQAIWSLPGKLILPYTLLKAIALILINTIPLFGPLIVVFIQAPTKGLQAHARYFSLKGYSPKQIKQIYRQNRGQYMAFGVFANFLESIPILSIFFMFTNTVGAALWVIEIERKLSANDEKYISRWTVEPDLKERQKTSSMNIPNDTQYVKRQNRDFLKM